MCAYNCMYDQGDTKKNYTYYSSWRRVSCLLWSELTPSTLSSWCYCLHQLRIRRGASTPQSSLRGLAFPAAGTCRHRICSRIFFAKPHMFRHLLFRALAFSFPRASVRQRGPQYNVDSVLWPPRARPHPISTF